MKIKFILVTSIFSLFISLGAQEYYKPTIEELNDCTKVKISFEWYRDEKGYDTQLWHNIVQAGDRLIDYCREKTSTKTDFKEIYNTIDYIRDEHKNNPSSIHRLVSVSVGDPSQQVSNPEHSENIVWMGCVATGSNQEIDTIKEITIIITDPQLNFIAQSPLFTSESTQTIESSILNFIKQYTGDKPILAGQDQILRQRAVLKKIMPTLESYFSPITINCFSMREFCMLWNQPIYVQQDMHSSLESAYQAIEEARFYQQSYFTR